MTDENKTHYRKAFNSPYLSSADIVEPVTLTIKCVRLEPDKTKKTKDCFNTAYFVEKEIRKGEELKPMILNATNSATMAGFTNSKFIDDWNNVPVSIYVDSNVRFGKNTVEGLRISTVRPNTTKPELTPDSPRWKQAIDACVRDGNADKVLSRVTISAQNKAKLLAESGLF